MRVTAVADLSTPLTRRQHPAAGDNLSPKRCARRRCSAPFC